LDFTKTIAVAATGLRAQASRMRVISENIANADSTAPSAGGDPYRRRIATFSSQLDRELDARVVGAGRARPDMSEFQSKYQPSHPAADARGYVKYPNVNSLVELTDMREAQRSYEANMNVISAARRMIQRTLDILRS
jgi:flagellar basal-body rod protein FlgC